MGPTHSNENEVWDLDRLRVPAVPVGDISTGSTPPRRHFSVSPCPASKKRESNGKAKSFTALPPPRSTETNRPKCEPWPATANHDVTGLLGNSRVRTRIKGLQRESRLLP
jgi:hypothetical protein